MHEFVLWDGFLHPVDCVATIAGTQEMIPERTTNVKLISQKGALKKVFILHVIEYWCSTRIDHMIEVPLIANPREPGTIQFNSDHFMSAAMATLLVC